MCIMLNNGPVFCDYTFDVALTFYHDKLNCNLCFYISYQYNIIYHSKIYIFDKYQCISWLHVKFNFVDQHR